MKHLLDTRELTREEAIEILDVADYMAQVKAENRTLNVLNGKTVVNPFFEDSTDTRLSFESAEKRLGAAVTNFSASGSSLSKGESLKDTAQTLKAIGADAFVDSPLARAGRTAAAWPTPAGPTSPCSTRATAPTQHPTQALLDAVSLRQCKAERDGLDSPRGTDLSGMRVLIVGDILHSRVARSNLWLLHTLGAQVVFVAPPTLLPLNTASWVAEAGLEIFHDFDEAIATKPDAVMLLRIQKERMRTAYFPSAEEYTDLWGLTAERFATLQEQPQPVSNPAPGPHGTAAWKSAPKPPTPPTPGSCARSATVWRCAWRCSTCF